MTQERTRYLRPLLIGFVAAACTYMFFLEPWGHDTWFHLQRLLDVEGQIGEGRLRAHLSGDAAQGKGLPVWIYYSQWVYWPAIVPRALGASPLLALKLVYCIALAVGCLGCYRLFRQHGTERTAIFGTLLFVTSNYVIGEIFQRAAYAEFLSVALLPYLLYCVHGVLTGEGRNRALGVVVLAGLMILFHPLSFMNAGIGIAAYALYVATRPDIPWSRPLRLVPLFALALALTAFYWLPAVIETRYVMGEEGVPTRLSETFLDLWKYLNFTSVTNMGPVLTVLFPFVALGLLFRGGRAAESGRPASWPLFAGILLYVFLTLRVSAPLYENVPLLASTLWVWRVLFPLILLVVIFVTSRLDALPRRLRTGRALTAVGILCVLQAAVFVLWNSAEEVSLESVTMQEIRRGVAEEWPRMEGFGVDEYLPRPQALPQPGGACRRVVAVEPEGLYEIRLQVQAGEPGTCLHVPRLWNIRYRAQAGGYELPVYATDEGEMLVATGGRSGELTLRLVRPEWATLAYVVSIAAALVFLLMVFLAQARARRAVRRPGARSEAG